MSFFVKKGDLFLVDGCLFLKSLIRLCFLLLLLKRKCRICLCYYDYCVVYFFFSVNKVLLLFNLGRLM